MYTHALDGHDGCTRVEVFAFERSDFAAVEGVGVGGAEMLNIKIHGAAGDFLVRRKADAEFRVRHLGVRRDVGGH